MPGGTGKAKLARALLAGTALGCALLPISARAAQVPTSRSSTFQLTLPLLFDGAYQGDIPVSITDGAVSVDIERFIALLGRRISLDLALRLREAAAGNPNMPLSALPALGVEASYDAATLELRVAIPIAQQGTQTVLAYERQQELADFRTPQSDFSATAILTARQTNRWGTRGTSLDLRPVRFSADIAANFRGADGISLFAQLEHDGGDGGFQRGNILLVHDDIARAIRYSAGDVAPIVAGFQTSPLIGGVAVERQYGVLQPFRNIRPSGQFSFILENASTVDVVVNGSTLRTIRLEAGQYNLRDFPFFNGLNQVELYVVDSFGRRLLASFSQYFSARLLDRGIFEFGAAGGVLERTARGLGSRYRGDRPAFTGFVRYGLTDDITAGANLQLSTEQRMGGLEFAWASPIGTIGALAAISDADLRGSGHAFLISYEGSARRIGPFIRPQLNLEFESTSRNFSPVTQTPILNRYSYSIQGRFTAQLPAEFAIGLSIAHLEGRGFEPTQTRYGGTLSRRFWRVNVTASYERVDTIGPLRQDRFLLTMSLPIGSNQAVRASYDTRDNLVALEYARFQRDEVDTIGIRAALSRGDSGANASGELAYNHNRFTAVVEHTVITDERFARVQSQETSFTLATQIALAGDSVVVGRPVGARFAIVSAHPTLQGGQVEVRQGAGRDHPQARSGALGPALAPAGNAYTPNQLRVEVRNGPAGYDIGPGQYNVLPSAAAGYDITVGSDASRVVIGVAVDAAGSPIGLQGGTIRSLDNPDFRPGLVFTNRAGRFVATGLAPGRYELTLGERGQLQVELTVAADASGVVTVGNVIFTEAETSR